MGIRLWLGLATFASSAIGAAACQSSTFACQSNDTCAEGRCEPQGWCSFPDEACPSGYRFGEHAAEGLAGICVDVDPGGTDAGSTTLTTTTSTTSTTEPTTSGTTAVPTTADSDETESTQTTASVDMTEGSTTAAASSSSESGDTTTGTTGPNSPVVVTLPITTNANDGAIYATTRDNFIWAQSGEDGAGNGFFGEYPDGEYYVAYFRFALPPEIDSGTLVDARLAFTATPQVTYMWSLNHAVGIWIQSSPDAPAVSGVEAFPWMLGGPPSVGVSLVESSVRWPEDGGLTWAAGTNTSPDISPLVTALRDEVDGLSSGDHIQFWLAVAEPTGVGGEVTYVDSSTGAATAPQLELTFEFQ